MGSRPFLLGGRTRAVFPSTLSMTSSIAACYTLISTSPDLDRRVALARTRPIQSEPPPPHERRPPHPKTPPLLPRCMWTPSPCTRAPAPITALRGELYVAWARGLVCAAMIVRNLALSWSDIAAGRTKEWISLACFSLGLLFSVAQIAARIADRYQHRWLPLLMMAATVDALLIAITILLGGLRSRARLQRHHQHPLRHGLSAGIGDPGPSPGSTRDRLRLRTPVPGAWGSWWRSIARSTPRSSPTASSTPPSTCSCAWLKEPSHGCSPRACAP